MLLSDLMGSHKYPTGVLVLMSVVVEADEKGRVLLPIEVRRRLKSKRFRISIKDGLLELEPLPSVKELKGKYRNVIRSEWEELEERAEEFVSKGKR